MTIRRGQSWGQPGALDAGAPVVHSDAELAVLVTQARRTGTELPVVGLLGGDLCRTVGGGGEEVRLARGGVRLPIDVVRAEIDGTTHWFTSHLVARSFRCWGRVVVAMNAQWLGDLRLGPRAHPNDGRIDITDGTLPRRDRAEARRRARSGSHLPHPALTTSRVATAEMDLGRGLGVWLDGVRVARRARRVVLTVEPDALEVVV